MLLFKKPSLILLGIILGLIVLISLTYTHYGKTWDENDTVALGNHALAYYQSFGRDRSYFSFYPQEAFYLTRGPIVETMRAVITTTLHTTSSDVYHLVIALFAISGFIFIYLLVYHLTQKVPLALFSSLLLLLLPRFYGAIFTDSKDIAPLYFLLGAMYLSVLFLTGKKNIWISVFLGIFLGLAASMRIILLYTYGVFLITALFQTLTYDKKKHLKALILPLLIGIITLISLYIFQPYLLLHPVTGLWQMLEASKNFPQTMQVLFAGKVYSSTQLPWFYVPVYIAVTTPLVTLALFVLGTFIILFRKRTLLYLYMLSLFWIPFLLTTFTHVVLYDAWRQLLFLYAPMTIIALIGLWETLLILPTLYRYLFISVVALGLLWTGISMLQLHPYEYVYFNELLGGTKRVYGKFETDYWGQSFKEASLWINDHQKEFVDTDGKVYVRPCVPMLASPYLDPKIHIDNEKASVYFCINRPSLPNPGYYHLIHIVARHGAPLNLIFTK